MHPFACGARTWPDKTRVYWCVAYVTHVRGRHVCIGAYTIRTRSDVHVHVAAYRARALCAFNYSQRGPWGNWGMGWDKGVKIIARSSLEADRWLLHSPLHLLPSASLCARTPDDYPIPPTLFPPARTFTDPWDSLTGQTKNGRFEAHPPLPRLTSGV